MALLLFDATCSTAAVLGPGREPKGPPDAGTWVVRLQPNARKVRSTDVSDSTRDGWPPASESVAEQVRRKRVRPVESVDDMAQPGIFESDEELEAFLAHVHAARHGQDDAYRGRPDATAGA